MERAPVSEDVIAACARAFSIARRSERIDGYRERINKTFVTEVSRLAPMRSSLSQGFKRRLHNAFAGRFAANLEDALMHNASVERAIAYAGRAAHFPIDFIGSAVKHAQVRLGRTTDRDTEERRALVDGIIAKVLLNDTRFIRGVYRHRRDGDRDYSPPTPSFEVLLPPEPMEDHRPPRPTHEQRRKKKPLAIAPPQPIEPTEIIAPPKRKKSEPKPKKLIIIDGTAEEVLTPAELPKPKKAA